MDAMPGGLPARASETAAARRLHQTSLSVRALSRTPLQYSVQSKALVDAKAGLAQQCMAALLVRRRGSRCEGGAFLLKHARQADIPVCPCA